MGPAQPPTGESPAKKAEKLVEDPAFCVVEFEAVGGIQASQWKKKEPQLEVALGKAFQMSHCRPDNG